MGEVSARESLDRMLDNIYNVIPLFHLTILKVNNLGHNPMSSEFKVMGILVRHGSLPMSHVGLWLGISKPNMTSIIDKLIEEGRAERRTDRKDRRIIEVILTTEGKKYMQACWKEARESMKTKLSTISKDEMETLYNSLENIRIILQKINEMNKQ
jgi:DNA-binding MarR family transcriptional regulator